MARQIYEKSREDWKDGVIGDTPVMAENLNHIEDGIRANSTNMALKEIYSDDAVSLGRCANTAVGLRSFAYGMNVEASGLYSQAVGFQTKASGANSHAEGNGTTASNESSHAEGGSTKAEGMCSHAEGQNTSASGSASHAEGVQTIASGSCSHAEGYFTKAGGRFQHVQGKYNVEDTEGKYADIVGGGTSDSDRKNIYTLDWEGNAEFAGDVTDGNGTSISYLLSKIEALEAVIESLV